MIKVLKNGKKVLLKDDPAIYKVEYTERNKAGETEPRTKEEAIKTKEKFEKFGRKDVRIVEEVRLSEVVEVLE